MQNTLYQSCPDAQGAKAYFKCRTQSNLRICKALEAEIDREIERVNSIISPPKQPQQKNLFTDLNQ